MTLIAPTGAAIKALAVRSCIVDGELIACDANGLADFQLLRWRKSDDPAIYCAFDLIEAICATSRSRSARRNWRCDGSGCAASLRGLGGGRGIRTNE
jgi:ATP-dependent DNA ligase